MIIPAILITILMASITAASQDQIPVRRYVLSAGSNSGGRERVMLRYAVSDARAFAAVLTEMGGVSKSDAVVLTNPNSRELLGGIASIGKLVAENKAAAPEVRNEVFVYYSGHADRDGLKLGHETLKWSAFRGAVSGMDADIRVAVLDACGSGAITRTKGGAAYPAFLSDASSNMKGYAFLTSSNEREASQECDRLRGGFFTHALLNGMRGAADLTGNGRVTINEAYLYAFNETLRSTQNTAAGAQHPSRDMNLSGTGDIVLTDLRETSATLALAPDTEGRFFIRDEKGNHFAELSKAGGRTVELGMPPGKYSVQMETPSKRWAANSVTVAEGQRSTLAMGDMKAVPARGRTTARGEELLSIASRGIYDVTGYADVTGDFTTSMRAGTPWFYGIAEYGSAARQKYPIYRQSNPGSDRSQYETQSDSVFRPSGFGFGAGTRFGMNGRLNLNLDLVWQSLGSMEAKTVVPPGPGSMEVKTAVPPDPDSMEEKEPGNQVYFNEAVIRFNVRFQDCLKLRLGTSYTPHPLFSVTGGLSLNGIFDSFSETISRKPAGGIYLDREFNDLRMRLWPGIYAGVTVGKVRAN